MDIERPTAIDPEEAASAFFDSLEQAERAEAKLKKAGFTSDVIYLVPRAPGVTLTVADAGRVEEASQILLAAGGELREADVNASGSVMFRLSPKEITPSTRPDDNDDDETDVERPFNRRSTDEEGAGSATGGALF